MSGFADRGGMSTTPATGTTPVTATSSASPSWRFTLSRLQREWDRLVADPRLGERVATWQLPGVVAGATLADVLCAAGMRPAGATPHALVPPALGAGEGHALERVPGDRALAALAAAAAHDELAARVVLQRLLPGLSSIARRRSRSVEEHLVHTDELLGAAWTVILPKPPVRGTTSSPRRSSRRSSTRCSSAAAGDGWCTSSSNQRAWTWRTNTTTAPATRSARSSGCCAAWAPISCAPGMPI